MSGESKRLFFGYDLTISEKSQIDKWRTNNYPNQPKAVPWQNYHITLAFLGQVKVEDIDPMVERVAEIQKSEHTLMFNRLGFWSRPKAFWLGVEHCPESLSDYAHHVASVGVKFGYRIQHRTYQPHITLMRGVKSELPAPLVAPAFIITTDNLTLFESVSTNKGVRYQPLTLI